MAVLSGVYPLFNKCWEECQDVYVISDTHFFDADLRQAIPDRPTDDNLIALINKRAGAQSALIHLGDVGDINAVHKLRAKYKILVLGNHDQGASNYQRQYVYKKYDANIWTRENAIKNMQSLYPNWNITIEQSYDFHAPCIYWKACADNKLFDLVFTGPVIIGEKLILSHEPLPNLTWCLNLHGHIHNKSYANDNTHFNVCCDVFGYKPLNLNKFLKEGGLSKIDSIHRITIDNATARKKR